MKILVVEDDAGLADLLARTLSKQHYQVETAIEGEAGWELVEAFEYDLVLLDLYLPKLDGIEFCRRLRANKHDVPVLLMTAEDTQAIKVMGLDAGADDFVVKPLDLEELLARVRALLRRGRCESSPTLTWGPLSIEPSTCEVFCHGQPLHLAGKQYELLELFLRYPNRIFNASALIERLWSFDNIPSENAVRTHVKNLRNKLKESGVEEIFETVYGLGYRLRAEPEDLSSLSPTAPAMPAPDLLAVGANTNVMVGSRDPVMESSTAIWERNQRQYLELIAALDQAVQTLQAAVGTPPSAAEKQLVLARSQKNAHRLKGSLGCFGLMAASQIAAQIEQILLAASPSEHESINQLPGLVEQLRQSLQHPVEPVVEAASPYPEWPQPGSSYRWLIIDDDQALTEELAHQASNLGIETHTATTLNEASQILEQDDFDVVMWALDSMAMWAEGLALLSELKQQQPSASIIVVTAQDTLADRVTVLRSGDYRVLQKPVTAAQILQTVLHSLPSQTLPVARILVLDDDPQILEYLEQVLAPQGFELTLVSDPIQFWDTLKQAQPDLLILDIEMPDFNGLDLCQVVRRDPTLCQLPILFLSAHTEPDMVRQVFEVGADDYLSKPISGSELIARIGNRLERVRRLRHSGIT